MSARLAAGPTRVLAGALLLLTAFGCDRFGRRSAADDMQLPELEAVVDSILPRVAALANLELIRPVRLERRSRADVRAFVEQRIVEELPADELEGVRLTYATLGLLPDTLDLRALLLDLYAEQVVGYYDPRTERLYIVDGVPRNALVPVLIHELVHALQDQHADIDALIAKERGNDRQAAAHAALEGHAMLVMFAFLAEQATGAPIDPALLPNPAEELAAAFEAQHSDFPVFRRAPAVIRRTLLFPYVHGASFVHQFWLQRHQDAVRRAPLGADLPQSTEQILHPLEKFIRMRAEPVEIRFAEDAPWPVLYENTFGEFETGVFLEEHLGADAAENARDWGGDRYRLLQAPDGERAIVWLSVWDDQPAADRFAAALRRVAAARPDAGHDLEWVTIDGRPAVQVIITTAGLDPVNVPRMQGRLADAVEVEALRSTHDAMSRQAEPAAR